MEGELGETGVQRGGKTPTKQAWLRKLNIRQYYATEYNDINKELALLEERAIALKEHHESVITGCSEMWLPPLKPSLPLKYVKNVLKRRDAILRGLITSRSQKRYIPLPLLMILKKYYPILVYKPQLPSQKIPRSPPPPYFASTSLRKNQEKQREIPPNVPAGRVITDKGTVEPESSVQEKRGETPLESTG